MLKAKVCKAFILLVLVFCLFPTAMAGDFVPMELNGEESYAMNLFLSNFTEVGVEKVDSFTDHNALAIFGHHHIWCNDYEAFEYGDYFNGNNCRVPYDRILKTINSFFYYENGGADYLNQSIFDEDGEYYYHCETGGWSNSGFAYTLSVCPIGNDKYFVSFANFEFDAKWNNSVLDDELTEIIGNYGTPSAYGSALIYAANLSDRSSYKMISYSRI